MSVQISDLEDIRHLEAPFECVSKMSCAILKDAELHPRGDWDAITHP